jgi:hypothetical protein
MGAQRISERSGIWGNFLNNLTLKSMVCQSMLGGSCGDPRFSN